MVTLIKVRTQGELQTAIKSLNRMKRSLPKMTSEGMRRWGRILERHMKLSARRAGIRPFTGNSYNRGIRWEQRKTGKIGRLKMPLYMVYLDSMRPHYVSVHRRRIRLLRWAKQSRSRSLRIKARKLEQKKLNRFSIYVKPHPFIRVGYRRARSKLRPVLKRLAKRAVKQAAR